MEHGLNNAKHFHCVQWNNITGYFLLCTLAKKCPNFFQLAFPYSYGGQTSNMGLWNDGIRDFPGGQRLRIRLPTWGAWLRSLIQRDPTQPGAAEPGDHGSWACVPHPGSHDRGRPTTQSPSPQETPPWRGAKHCHDTVAPTRCSSRKSLAAKNRQIINFKMINTGLFYLWKLESPMPALWQSSRSVVKNHMYRNHRW